MGPERGGFYPSTLEQFPHSHLDFPHTSHIPPPLPLFIPHDHLGAWVRYVALGGTLYRPCLPGLAYRTSYCTSQRPRSVARGNLGRCGVPAESGST